MTADPTPNNERRWVCEAIGVKKCRDTDNDTHPGCGYVDAAPVPSPVPSRPDTATMREVADELNPEALGWLSASLRLWADWIDAQPAADQGPDLSELAGRWPHGRDTFTVTYDHDADDALAELRAVRASLVGCIKGAGTATAFDWLDLLDAVNRVLADREGGTQ